MAYKKCPRCSLNYIKSTDVLCKICLKEVEEALRSNDEEEEYDICPECGEHIIRVGEEMCYQCMLEENKDEVDSEENKGEDEWDKIEDEAVDGVLYDDDEEEVEQLTVIDLEEEAEEEEE